jgi:hypothetical protein
MEHHVYLYCKDNYEIVIKFEPIYYWFFEIFCKKMELKLTSHVACLLFYIFMNGVILYYLLIGKEILNL